MTTRLNCARAGKYSLMKKRLRRIAWHKGQLLFQSAGKYSLMKKRLRRQIIDNERHVRNRRKVFADEEAIETSTGASVTVSFWYGRKVFADEEAIETQNDLPPSNNPHCRKVFADEEAIETEKSFPRAAEYSSGRKVFADEEAIETQPEHHPNQGGGHCAGKYSLMKKRLRQPLRQGVVVVARAGKYSLMKKRLRRKPCMFVEHPYCRRKVFADEEAIETRPAP